MRHQKYLDVSDSLELPQISDLSESDTDKRDDSGPIKCTSPHEGRLIINEVIPMNIDKLFALLFTDATFMYDFFTSRKCTDIIQKPWSNNAQQHSQTRVITLTAPIEIPFGSKCTFATETQTLLPCSKPDCLYGVDVEISNTGISYADCFTINYHYCIQKASQNSTSFMVYARIVYKKSVLGLIKGFIEKSTWSGLDDFFGSLIKVLLAESKECNEEPKRRNKSHRRRHKITPDTTSSVTESSGISRRTKITLITLLILLVGLNALLYNKLQGLEEEFHFDLNTLDKMHDTPTTYEEWIQLLDTQEKSRNKVTIKWYNRVKESIELLKQSEENLKNLQDEVHPVYTRKVSFVGLKGQTQNVNKIDQEL